ncbi:metal-dependent transcriptional regulator (plasmid) [Citricoccus sp. SGAir0253]|uniref:metal-dependent transcriptional regulator n=1 Tax=Citricoccus sp. SGAir0253 TaxID=2567881 RepID=UPI0010CD0073|nr:metal-dependent transcriptional regulator [Citricoccus sp. SGAir0253]QCU79738.1 metal-dependent transcriptional regulator [Citricoccus sp. SGAir0253]
MDPSELTPVAQDYLKVIWSATEWGDPPITTKALAERMGTSAPNVTDTVKRLAAQGLVEHRPYKPVTLTAAGRDYAVAMVRRHRLLEAFLVTTLDYSWEEVHDEAERLEHAASDTMIERIDTALGHPDHDPHGDPIPTRAGHTHRPAHTLRLAEAAPGSYRIVRISDADPAHLNRFAGHDLLPGRPVQVTDRSDGGTSVIIPATGRASVALTRRRPTPSGSRPRAWMRPGSRAPER